MKKGPLKREAENFELGRSYAENKLREALMQGMGIALHLVGVHDTVVTFLT